MTTWVPDALYGYRPTADRVTTPPSAARLSAERRRVLLLGQRTPRIDAPLAYCPARGLIVSREDAARGLPVATPPPDLARRIADHREAMAADAELAALEALR